MNLLGDYTKFTYSFSAFGIFSEKLGNGYCKEDAKVTGHELDPSTTTKKGSISKVPDSSVQECESNCHRIGQQNIHEEHFLNNFWSVNYFLVLLLLLDNRNSKTSVLFCDKCSSSKIHITIHPSD